MEQYLIESCYLLLRNLYQIIICFWAISYMLEPRFNRTVCILGGTLISFTFEVTTSAEIPLFRSVGFVISLLIPAIFFYKDKIMYRLFAVGMLILGYIFMDIIASCMSYAIAGEFLTSMNAVHTWDSIVYIVATDIFLTGGFLFVVVVWNRFFKRSHVKSLGLFVLFPVSQFSFFCACSYQTWTLSQLDLMKNPFMLASILLSLVADIAMYRALMQNSKTHELSQKLSDMQHQMELQLQYYDGLADKMQQVREYRHDINNLIEVTESLIRSNSTNQDGRILLEEIKVKTANAKIPVFSSNPTVNAVLYHKQSSARELGVEFRVEMEISEDFPFERSDICSVFANLLDNALREAAGCANGFTEVSAKRNMGLLKIEVRNSTEKNLDLGKEKPSTDKPEPEKHGYGLEIVESIARKYDGKFVLTAENGIARAAVSLPLSMSSVKENELQKVNAFSLSESN